MFAHLKELDRQVAELEREIQAVHREDESSRRLAEIPDIGPLTATALLASVGQISAFRNGRQLAAWIGLVPRQHSSGSKPTLLAISKRGDSYLTWPGGVSLCVCATVDKFALLCLFFRRL